MAGVEDAPDPHGGEGTSVTQIYNWNQVTDDGCRGMFPMLTEEQIADSIARAGRAAG